MAIKRRSPNYPGISLEDAVGVLAALYQGTSGPGVGRGEFTRQDAASAWGYTSAAGPVKVRLASLRQYGFLEGKKGGNPRLTNRALTVILRNQASREHRDAIALAVLTPPIFAELHHELESAAPDAMRQFLVVEKNFTNEGANRLISVYAASMAYAGIDEYDNMGEQIDDDLDNEDQDEEEVSDMPPPPPPALSQAGTMNIPIPFGSDRLGNVTLPIDLTNEEWKRFDRILKGYRPPEEKTTEQQATSETGNS